MTSVLMAHSQFTFPKRLRLLRPPEFDRVMQARASATDGLIRMYIAANELGHPRLGLTVSRKVGGAATRNVWKRALREAFRLTQQELPACDIVCIPHRDSQPDVARLADSLQKLSRRIDEQLRRRSK
jgi:ribonuclease P protein component